MNKEAVANYVSNSQCLNTTLSISKIMSISQKKEGLSKQTCIPPSVLYSYRPNSVLIIAMVKLWNVLCLDISSIVPIQKTSSKSIWLSTRLTSLIRFVTDCLRKYVGLINLRDGDEEPRIYEIDQPNNISADSQ